MRRLPKAAAGRYYSRKTSLHHTNIHTNGPVAAGKAHSVSCHSCSNSAGKRVKTTYRQSAAIPHTSHRTEKERHGHLRASETKSVLQRNRACPKPVLATSLVGTTQGAWLAGPQEHSRLCCKWRSSSDIRGWNMACANGCDWGSADRLCRRTICE